MPRDEEQLAIDGSLAAKTLANRLFSPFAVSGISLVVEAVLIHAMSGHGDFLRRGEAWKFTACALAAGLAYWLAAACAVRTKFTNRRSICLLWVGAVMLRAMILPVAPGDDIWRYRWEGMIQQQGFNPYRTEPEAPELAKLRDEDWARINHRDYPAIYPPLAECVFAGVAAAGNAVFLYKILFALVDLGIIAVLWRMLAGSSGDTRQVVWYAWNPLVIYSFAGAAHFDCLMILALLAAIWTLQGWANAVPQGADEGATPMMKRFWWPSSLLLGMAVAIKIAPLVLLPVWAFALRSWQRVAFAVPAILAPLMISAFAYGYPAAPVFSTLKQFGLHFKVNEPVWWLVDLAGWPDPAGNNAWRGSVALAVCAVLAYRFRRDWQRSVLWVWGAALILSPVVHAWYVAWVLPVAAWRGRQARSWFVFSISMFGYFLLWEVNHDSGKPWEEPLWLRLIILLPPLIVWIWTGIHRSGDSPGGVGSSLNSDDSAATIGR